MNSLLSNIEDSTIENACNVVALLPEVFVFVKSVKKPTVHYANGDYVIKFKTISSSKIDFALKRLIESFIESEIKLRHPYAKLNAQVIMAVDIWFIDIKRTLCIHYEI